MKLCGVQRKRWQAEQDESYAYLAKVSSTGLLLGDLSSTLLGMDQPSLHMGIHVQEPLASSGLQIEGRSHIGIVSNLSNDGHVIHGSELFGNSLLPLPLCRNSIRAFGDRRYRHSPHQFPPE